METHSAVSAEDDRAVSPPPDDGPARQNILATVFIDDADEVGPKQPGDCFGISVFMSQSMFRRCFPYCHLRFFQA